MIWSDLICFDLIWFYPTWSNLNWSHLIWLDLNWSHLISFDLIWSHLIWIDLKIIPRIGLTSAKDLVEVEAELGNKNNHKNNDNNNNNKNDFNAIEIKLVMDFSTFWNTFLLLPLAVLKEKSHIDLNIKLSDFCNIIINEKIS